MNKTLDRLNAYQDAILWALAAAVVGLYVLLAQQAFDLGFPLDDSWIHQVYARNLADRGEWAFVAGESSTASTSPLYTVLMAIGHLFNLSPFFWAHLWGILALGAAGSLGARLGRMLFPATPYADWATGLAMVLAWHVIWAAASGMETMLFMSFSLGLIYLSLRQLDEFSPIIPAQKSKKAARLHTPPLSHQGRFTRGLAFGAVGALLTLTRPEGLGLVGLLGLGMLLAYGLAHRQNYLIWAGGVVLGYLLLISPYTAWNWQLSGELLPSTAAAKIAENDFARQDPLPSRYLTMLVPLIAGPQLIALPAILTGLWLVGQQARQNRRYWLALVPALWAVAHLSLFALRLPAPYQHGRYVIPILPPLLLYTAGGAWYLLERGKYSVPGRVFSRSLALSIVLAFPSFVWIGAQAYASDVRIINSEMVETAKWVRDNIPPDELFAVHDIGALAYYAPRDILDLAGLVSPEVVPIINNYPAQMELICEQGAAWLMVLPDQRPAAADDPRLSLVYESPYDYADRARGADEAWKMRVYAVKCP